MLKGRRNIRERKVNKENIHHQDENDMDRRDLEKGARQKLNELSEGDDQYRVALPKNPDLMELCPWVQNVDQAPKIRCSTRISRNKKSQDLQSLKESRSLLKRKYSTADVKTKIGKSLDKQVHTQGNAEPQTKNELETDERISCIIKSISSRPSNLFPLGILRQTDRSAQYTAWRNSRLSLPTNIPKPSKECHIKVYPSYDSSQTNFNRMVLKCKESTLYFKNPPKQIQKQMVKYIGEHAVFVKCRQRSRFRFQQNGK